MELEFKILLHNKLCELADMIIYHYYPCKINQGKCVNGDIPCCYHGRYALKQENRKCLYLGVQGCTSPNLLCKLYICDKIKAEYPQLDLELRHIERLAKEYGLG